MSSKPQQLLCAKPIISVERLPLSKVQQMSLSDSHSVGRFWLRTPRGAASTPPKASPRHFWQISKAQRKRTGRSAVLISAHWHSPSSSRLRFRPWQRMNHPEDLLSHLGLIMYDSQHGFPSFPVARLSQVSITHFPPGSFSSLKVLQAEFQPVGPA